MNKVFVLYWESWGGTHYSTEFVCVYADEEIAYRTALHYQSNHKLADIAYRVEEVEFDGLVP